MKRISLGRKSLYLQAACACIEKYLSVVKKKSRKTCTKIYRLPIIININRQIEEMRITRVDWRIIDRICLCVFLAARSCCSCVGRSFGPITWEHVSRSNEPSTCKPSRSARCCDSNGFATANYMSELWSREHLLNRSAVTRTNYSLSTFPNPTMETHEGRHTSDGNTPRKL